MQLSVRNYKRIVIKIGSSLFYSIKGSVDFSFFKNITSQIIALLEAGKEVIIVSSGAITLGVDILGLKEKPKDLSYLQAVAAIGQNALMDLYNSEFAAKKIKCAQVLLTREDLNDRRRYLNAKNTLLALFKLGSVPVINENDTVSTEEIKFGDNDRLSALVAALINADLLIMLSDVDGLMDAEKKVIRIVDGITPEIKSLACPSTRKTCVGGMITKLEAAKIAVDSGIPCVIANGHTKDIILSVTEDTGLNGTTFLSKKSLAAKERWIAFGTKPKGSIVVDDGAKNALLNNKSLLSVGIVAVEGNFEHTAVVSIIDKQGSEFARGKAGLSAKQIDKVKGVRFTKEVIHCDNIVIL